MNLHPRTRWIPLFLLCTALPVAACVKKEDVQPKKATAPQGPGKQAPKPVARAPQGANPTQLGPKAAAAAAAAKAGKPAGPGKGTPQTPAPGDGKALGDWVGTVTTEAGDVYCTVNLDRGPAGAPRVMVSLPYLGIASQPAKDVLFTSEGVVFEVDNAQQRVRFSGKPTEKGTLGGTATMLAKAGGEPKRCEMQLRRVGSQQQGWRPRAFKGSVDLPGRGPTMLSLITGTIPDGETLAVVHIPQSEGAAVPLQQVSQEGTQFTAQWTEGGVEGRLALSGGEEAGVLEGTLQRDGKEIPVKLELDPHHFAPKAADPAAKAGAAKPAAPGAGKTTGQEGGQGG